MHTVVADSANLRDRFGLVGSMIAHRATEQHDGTALWLHAPLVRRADGQHLVGETQPRVACCRRLHNWAW